jgi:hypothetical protein
MLAVEVSSLDLLVVQTLTDMSFNVIVQEFSNLAPKIVAEMEIVTKEMELVLAPKLNLPLLEHPSQKTPAVFLQFPLATTAVNSALEKVLVSMASAIALKSAMEVSPMAPLATPPTHPISLAQTVAVVMQFATD